MRRISELPNIIPIFPLNGAVLLPRARLPLHIFEPRYLTMIEDALKTPERLIGMIQPYPVPGQEEERLYSIGCAGRLTQFSETDDGRYMITLSGVSRFRVTSEIEGFTAYRRCRVDWTGFERDMGHAERDPGLNRSEFFELLNRYFDAKSISTDWTTLKSADDELMVNSLAMLLEFASEDKQALLEAPSLVTRRETLVTLIEFALRAGGGTEGEDLLQ